MVVPLIAPIIHNTNHGISSVVGVFYNSIPPRIAFIDGEAFATDWFFTVEPFQYRAGLEAHESRVATKACELFRRWQNTVVQGLLKTKKNEQIREEARQI
jgi:hypothetical protein